MITFSSSLNALLAGATNKQEWSNILISTLGDPRRVRCKRDANSSASDAWETGVEFLNAALTGKMGTTAGNISAFGIVNDLVIHLAADLSTGVSVMRIEGNGEWVQGTIGLTGSNCDFTVPFNPTATTGFGFTKSCGIKAPKFLPSGTGPAAPILDENAPAAIRVWDYADEANPVISGIGYLNVRDADLVFDHPALASDIGDVRITRMAEGSAVVIGSGSDAFAFAATLFSVHADLNAETNAPVHELRIKAKPYGRWASFPFRKDFHIESDILAPKAFKIDVLRADGTVLEVIEMYSTRVNDVPGTGKPINSTSQVCYMDQWQTQRIQPFWTCHMTLGYFSHTTKTNTYASHFLPGVEAEALDPSNVRYYDSAPDQWPIITGNYLANGLLSWRVAPKWCRAGNTGLDTNIVDPYFREFQRSGQWVTQLIGYGYEPGSVGQHTWYMSPGGSRHDRSCWPEPIVRWASDPNANRIHGAVPMATMVREWNKNYMNHGAHYFTNVELGLGVNKAKVLAGALCFNDAYYNGGNENYRPDIENNAIRLLTSAASVHDYGYSDKYGRTFTNQYQRDLMHNQSNAAPAIYLNNSPSFIFDASHMFSAGITCAWDISLSYDARGLLGRDHAWYNWQLSQMWMVSNSDPRFYSRYDIESMWQRHLENTYDNLMPHWNDPNSVYGVALRTYGCAFMYQYALNDGTGRSVYEVYDSKQFYWGQVLLFMKQSGSWDAMRAKSSKCEMILDIMMECLCKASIDFFVDGGGRADKQGGSGSIRHYYPDGQFVQPTWETFVPPNGLMDFIHNPDGSIDSEYIEGFNTQHFRAQFVYIVRDFFPEYEYPRLDQAIAKLDGWYATVENGRKAGTNPPWHWRFTMMGVFKQPANVGAEIFNQKVRNGY